ncbi:hypothetical protein [Luteolibacter marinus]|uniref:hypothetical protein n=1 Tax=Luteolibacter marinus TaxID=2776705 RepID=UPI001867C3CB|nr:hypothetical protein [Luteolibacter marinus]
MLTTNLSDFHRWFLDGGAAHAPGIVLFGFPVLPRGLAAAVAGHLNEFDEDGGGRWTGFVPELLEQISATPAQRSLLNLGEGCRNCPPNSACGRRKVLEVLARRGNAVLEGMLAVEASANLSNIFRVSLGPAPNDGKGFHLVLQPDLFSERSLASIIGDTYLEWAAARLMAESV